MEGRVSVTIAHEGIGVGLEEVLDHLLLPCEYSKMERRLRRVVVVLRINEYCNKGTKSYTTHLSHFFEEKCVRYNLNPQHSVF